MLALPAELDVITVIVLASYLGTAVLLSVYGLHRLALLALYYRHRRAAQVDRAELPDNDLPAVLVQLPIYNERYVADRLLEAVAALDWPRDRLHVQVLDDSTDLTTSILAASCAQHRATGLQIDHVRRSVRADFKAGALAHGLRQDAATAQIIALFDADFIPGRDFLRRTVPVLMADERRGMVQCRWGHLNRSESLITKLQAILLDGHFVIEHSARFRSGRFFNFNGTAGIWRRQAIHDAGGWQGDTLCEDLDLSYRAQLAGWNFVYLQDFEVPAELPADIVAFKSQQHRWAKGSIQTARKLLPRIWTSALPFSVKVEAVFHLAGNLAYPIMALLLLLLPPSLAIRLQLDWTWGLLVDLPIFVCATINLVLFYAAAERELRDGGWLRRLHLIPGVLSLGAALTVNNTRAVWQAVRGSRSPFVRTPKAGEAGTHGYRSPVSRQYWLELALGLYYSVALVFAASQSLWHAMPFLALFGFGFLYLGGGSALQARAAQTAAASAANVAATVAPATKTPAVHMRAIPPTLEGPTDPPDSAPSKRDRRRVGGY